RIVERCHQRVDNVGRWRARGYWGSGYWICQWPGWTSCRVRVDLEIDILVLRTRAGQREVDLATTVDVDALDLPAIEKTVTSSARGVAHAARPGGWALRPERGDGPTNNTTLEWRHSERVQLIQAG